MIRLSTRRFIRGGFDSIRRSLVTQIDGTRKVAISISRDKAAEKRRSSLPGYEMLSRTVKNRNNFAVSVVSKRR